MRVLVFILGLLFSSPAFADDRREHLADGEIFVRTSPVEGSSQPKVHVEGVIDAPPDIVWRVVSNCQGSQEMNSNIMKSKVVKRVGKAVVCSELIDLPWPIRNLESVTRWTFQPGPPMWKKTWKLEEGAPDFDYANGTWTLTAFGDGSRTLAVYENHFYPRISVPDWLARAFLKVGMPGLIEDLRKASEQK